MSRDTNPLKGERTLQVHVEAIGLPALTNLWGGPVELHVHSNTFAGLIDALAGEFGPRVREILLDKDGRLDPEILVVVNEGEVLGRRAPEDYRAAAGDRIKFILMVGGG